MMGNVVGIADGEPTDQMTQSPVVPHHQSDPRISQDVLANRILAPVLHVAVDHEV
jgi:hypothetical protein